ncbi:MAG: type II toxin-antitoxin system Phd/YefM family antitoxin [Oligoflexia bacterium]|nr:type II toxin-antitoxin system Phd/YefM family antitoxin [Oligoflexia bacterium]
MKHKIISISKAKAELLSLAKRVYSNGEAFLITKDGEPYSVLIPVEEYDAMLETSELLADKNAMRNLKKALADADNGRTWKRDSKGKWIKSSISKNKEAA